MTMITHKYVVTYRFKTVSDMLQLAYQHVNFNPPKQLYYEKQDKIWKNII